MSLLLLYGTILESQPHNLAHIEQVISCSPGRLGLIPKTRMRADALLLAGQPCGIPFGVWSVLDRDLQDDEARLT